MFFVPSAGTLLHHICQSQQIEQIRRQAGFAPEVAVVAVSDAHRITAQSADTVGPQPGMISFISEMTSEFLLQVRVIGTVDQPQNEIRATQLGIPIVTEQQNIVGFLVHSVSSKKGSCGAPLLYHVCGVLAMPPSRASDE